MRDAIPARVKLEITLVYLSSGISYRLLSVFFRVSKASIIKIIPEVCAAINESLKDYIKIPNVKEWQDIQIGFASRWNFPNCCGSIDGKHITIQAPPNCGSEYYNYKGTNSIVLMAVVDHDYTFRYVDIGSYGRNADGGVFQNCSLYPYLENNLLLPENVLCLMTLGKPGGRVISGNSESTDTKLELPATMALTLGCSTDAQDAGQDKPPYKNTLTTAEKIFNYRLSRARRIVENGFGILASRFRVLGKPIQVTEETTIKIVLCACTLHNWLRTTASNTYTPPGTTDYEDIINFQIIQGQWRSEINELPSIRRSRINNRSKLIAEKMRDKYKNYFNDDGAVAWQNYMIR
ncbi:protein ANTAGONIST OF LIKE HETEROCHROMATIN PROTEIN 1-like [Aricia agestis]|uniref:protein ANTAGONIST OF LIKE HETEROCHROMATIN PROTEIN 1-like n=1 Tax=Aricia agestis TaxID=91739 RepID=UPI001C204191|nr:protein ANTAGONIST OF LIKE HETEROCHROMATIN PROTEIN 1-like [Aricia agestis]